MDLAHFWNTSGAYEIKQSLRFNSADSAYLNRTPASAGNRKTWTWSGWLKRSRLSTADEVFFNSNGGTDSTRFDFFWISNDTFEIDNYNTRIVRTTQVFRDPSAWYHLVVALDTTQATASNRLRVYINGQEITSFSIDNRSTAISQNADMGINGTTQHNVGGYTSYYYNGYAAEVNLIDGAALTPSSFGETDTITGAWIPKKYSGSYGTNGYYLKFDPSATNGIGHDHSGNGKHWTATGFSTSGTGTDVMSDTPTNNYATLNPIYLPTNMTISDGNLYFQPTATNWYLARSNFGVNSGKWYCEMKLSANNGCRFALTARENNDVRDTNAICYNHTGSIEKYASVVVNASSWGVGDVMGMAVDAGAGTCAFYKNGTLQGTVTGLDTTLTWFPAVDAYSSSTYGYWNFGQRAFEQTQPSGFKAWNTANLPEPTIKKGGAHFNTVLYTGDSAASHAITGVGFQPDFLWIKRRNGAQDHQAFDAVRGADKSLQQNATNAESDNDTHGSFDSDGFTLTGAGVATNSSGGTFVAWNWKANGAGSSNTAGTITSTVSANASAGFSIVTYTGNGSTATVGHGLGVAPRLVIVKKRAGGTMGGGYSDWLVYSQAAVDAGAGSDAFYYLNSTAGTSNSSSVFSGAPSSTVINIGNNQIINNSGSTFVAYCFSEVAGYSKFGSYTGNGSSDGPFVFTNFKVKWLMIKRTDTTGSWVMLDAARDPTNVVSPYLLAESAGAEDPAGAFDWLDFTSNGFKQRNTGIWHNASGGTYVYAAFAEHPFKYANAR